MNKFALSVENLTKVYSNLKTKTQNTALNNLSFQVREGEIFGLLGPNGAGKTTFLSILGGIVTTTGGKVDVWGFDLDKNSKNEPLRGIVKYINDELIEKGVKVGDEVLYEPNSEYEFVVDDEKLYRMFTRNITVVL